MVDPRPETASGSGDAYSDSSGSPFSPPPRPDLGEADSSDQAPQRESLGWPPPPASVFPQRVLPVEDGAEPEQALPLSGVTAGTHHAAYLGSAEEYDPTTDPRNWGPFPETATPRQRSVGQVLWPWGLRGFVESLEVLALALLMFLAVRSVGQNFVVDGGSMEPTFRHGEMLIVNKLVYRSFDVSWLPWSDNEEWTPFGGPSDGDIVVFKFPQDPKRDFIKRIIAAPGQTVQVDDGKVFIDGKQLAEPYLDAAPLYDYGPVTVPEGQYFVLGDNRNNSYDSHAWGMLDESFLIGRADIRYWPLGKAGRLESVSELAPSAGVSQSP